MTVKTRKTLISFLVENLRGEQRCFGEKLMSPDQQTVVWAKRLFATTILDAREAWGLETTTKTIRKFVKNLKKVSFDELEITLDRANQSLLNSVADPLMVTTFKVLFHKEREEAELIEYSIYALLIPLITGWFRLRDEAAFKLLRQVFTCLKQVGLTKVKRLKRIAFDGWRQIEANWHQPAKADDPEAMILAEWFPPWYEREAFENTLPHHGTGQVADPAYGKCQAGKVQLYQKYLLLYHCPELSRHMVGLGFGDLLPLPSDDFLQWMMPYDLMEHMRPNQWYDCCNVGWVPKSWKTYRTISEETACRMFWQQWVGEAVTNALYDWNEWSDETGHHRQAMFQISEHYCVTTEEWNRELTKLGSKDGSYVTIDLSMASDSVGLALVSYWFRKTWLWFWLVATRAKRARYNDPDAETDVPEWIVQKKFAPMGSRLCFPVETFVFAAIVESVIRATTGQPSKPGDYKVFGDDIVVRLVFAEKVMARLQELGFKVNIDKTFCNSSGAFFRESCGVEYLNGCLVTPLKLPKPFMGLPLRPSSGENPQRVDPSLVAAWIALANNFHELSCCRALIVWALLDLHKIPVLFDDGTCGIRSSQPTNFHLKSRYNLALQRWEVRAFRCVAKLKQVYLTEEDYKDSASVWPSLERVRLFEYLSSTACRDRLLYPEDAFQARRLDAYAQITGALDWIPAPEDTTLFCNEQSAASPLQYLYNGEWYDHRSHSWRTWLTI